MDSSGLNPNLPFPLNTFAQSHVLHFEVQAQSLEQDAFVTDQRLEELRLDHTILIIPNFQRVCLP
jgi:hypothetical protein